MPTGGVILHAGAGYHSSKKESLYVALCDEACRQGIRVLNEGGLASEAAVAVMKVLEDSVLTNAGIGSSVAYDGSVECDAMLMTSEGLCGAVGALRNIKNPIEVASLLLEQQRIPLPDGRVRPCLLVGDGAKKHAIANGIAVTDMDNMKTACSRKNFAKYQNIVLKHDRKRWKELFEDTDSSSPKRFCDDSMKEQKLDTVGVICFDSSNRIAAALSSGGIALKLPGRVGQAALIGSGCWVSDRVAVATTGCGEQLMKTVLAKSLADDLIRNADVCDANQQVAPGGAHLVKAIEQNFLSSELLRTEESKYGGAIALSRSSCGKKVELHWAHTTRSMCVSYMAADEVQPHSSVSRIEAGHEGKICIGSAVEILLK